MGVFKKKDEGSSSSGGSGSGGSAGDRQVGTSEWTCRNGHPANEQGFCWTRGCAHSAWKE